MGAAFPKVSPLDTTAPALRPDTATGYDPVAVVVGRRDSSLVEDPLVVQDQDGRDDDQDQDDDANQSPDLVIRHHALLTLLPHLRAC